jgi:DNA primase
VDQLQPRYRVPPVFAKSEVLFNMHRATATEESTVVIVEAFSSAKVHQSDIPSVVALMGAVLYESEGCALLNRFRRVIRMLDGYTTWTKGRWCHSPRLRARCRPTSR